MGASEEILAGFVKQCPREQVLISTKFTPQIAPDSPNAVEEMLDASLKRFATDYVDIYWIHNPADVERWTPGLIPALKKGKVKSVGVSNHNLAELKRAEEILSAEGFHVSAVQNHYSLIYRSSEVRVSSTIAVSTGWTSLPTWYWNKVHFRANMMPGT